MKDWDISIMITKAILSKLSGQMVSNLEFYPSSNYTSHLMLEKYIFLFHKISKHVFPMDFFLRS